MWHLQAWPDLRRCLPLVLLAACPDLAAADDLLILRDGSRQVGKVHCSGDRCFLGGQGMPREQIEWIGLRDPAAAPPAVRDATDDEVHLRDGTVRSGALVGISAGVVLTERGSFEREDVAWIHLIEGSADLDGGPERIGGPTASPPPSAPPDVPSPRPSPPPDTRKPTVDPPPSRTPRRSPPNPEGDTPSGDLWIGDVHGDLHRTTRDDHPDCRSQGVVTGRTFARYTTTLRVRLRETKRQPLGDRKTPGGMRIVAQMVELRNEGTAVESGFEASYPTANPKCRPSWSCSDRATTRFSDDDHPGGYLMYRTVAEPLRQGFPGLGDVEVPKEGLYTLFFDTLQKWAPCPKPSYSGYVHPPDHGYMIQNNALTIGDEAPGDVFRDPQRRLLTQNRSRMTGSYTQVRSTADGETRLNVRWDICRAGSTGCTIEDSGFKKKDDCGDSAPMSPRMSALWSQRKAMAEQLEKDWKELEEANAEVEGNKPAWRAAMAVCGIVDVLFETMEGVTGNFGTAAARLNKMVTGDLSYLGAGGGDALELVFETYASVFPSGPTAGMAANLRAKLSGCTGLTPDLRKGAQAFVDNFEKVSQLMPKVQRQVNDIKRKDQEFWDETQTNSRNCLEWARCMKLDPSVCDPAPAESVPR